MGTARAAIGLGAALIVAGAAFDLPALYVPGVAIVLLWAGSLVWLRLAARGAEVELERGPATVVEGEPYPLRIRIRRGVVPSRGELLTPLLERPLAVRTPVRRRVRRLNLTVRFPRRGRRAIEPPRWTLGDPLGLRRLERQSGDRREVLVLPRTEPVLAPAAGGAENGGMPEEFGGGGSGGAALDPRPIDFEIDGLRPYREGSPASRIHWPAVARTGQLHERRLVAGAESVPLVVLDAARPDDEDSLDRAVRATASLCLHLARAAGGCMLLLPGEGRSTRIDPQLRAWPEVHARLALVESRDGPPALGRARRAETVFWVSARSDGQPGGRAHALAARIAYLVTPASVPGARSAFTVAGCHGRALASRHRSHAARTRAV